MSVAIADPTATLLAALYADAATVAAVTHARPDGTSAVAIYGESLPLDPLMDEQIPAVAGAALVLAMQPGPVDAYAPLSYPRALLRAYHRTRQQARALWFAVAPVLHNRRFTQGNGRAINVSLASTPTVTLELDTRFPLCDGFFSCEVVGHE